MGKKGRIFFIKIKTIKKRVCFLYKIAGAGFEPATSRL
jgi:hypothetical protein